MGMSKYYVATLPLSGSVGRLKRSTETDHLEREEQAIFVLMYMSFYQNFGNLLENMYDMCIK